MLAHSSERVNSDSESEASKVQIQKTEARCSCLLPQEPKEIFSAKRTDWWIENSWSKMWISEQSPIRCRGAKVHATRWNSCQTKTSQETEKNLRKLTETVEEAKSYSYVQFVKICQVLWRIIMEWSKNYTWSIRHKKNCRMNCTSRKRRDISRIIAIWIGW